MSAEPEDGDEKMTAYDYAVWALTGSSTGPLPPTLSDLARRVEQACVSYHKGRVDRDDITISALRQKVERLESGDLTKEEFQNLCHNLHEKGKPRTFIEFAKGCVEFQAELFGLGDVSAAPTVTKVCPLCQGRCELRNNIGGEQTRCPQCDGKGKVPK